jgi:hypothetical protein
LFEVFPFSLIRRVFYSESSPREWGIIPGAKEYAIPTRPIALLESRIDEREKLLIEKQRSAIDPFTVKIVIIGGGASGIEIAFSLRSRWEPFFPLLTVNVIDAAQKFLPEFSHPASALHSIQMKKRCVQDGFSGHLGEKVRIASPILDFFYSQRNQLLVSRTCSKCK